MANFGVQRLGPIKNLFFYSDQYLEFFCISALSCIEVNLTEYFNSYFFFSLESNLNQYSILFLLFMYLRFIICWNIIFYI